MTYRSTFKTHGVEVESESILLNNNAWIERSPEFIGKPTNSSLTTWYSHHWRCPALSGFHNDLLESSIRFRTEYSSEESDKDPFKVDDCSHIAMAIAIVMDGPFVVGLESFSRGPPFPEEFSSPYGTLFLGCRNANSRTIGPKYEPRVRSAYEFVRHSLCFQGWDHPDSRLLLLATRCLINPPNHQTFVLKLSLEHLFPPWFATVVNAGLLLEHTLTSDSRNPEEKVATWNDKMSPEFRLDPEIVEMIMKHRHLVAHNNASTARAAIEGWKVQNGLSDLDAAARIRDGIVESAKVILRARVFAPNEFEAFTSGITR